MKILWQSFVDEDTNAAYLQRLSEYLNKTVSNGAEVDVIGLTPPARDFGRLQELRCGITAIKNAIEGERNGYDAFILGHFQDPLLYELRSSVEIPVIGLGEASLLWASHLGTRIALISLDDAFEVIHLEQVRRYGLADKLLTIKALNMKVEDFTAAFRGDTDAYQAILKSFQIIAEELVEQGADVIIPAGNLFGLLTANEINFKVGHAPVIPCTPVALGWAEQAIKLHKKSGLSPSRGPSFKKAGQQSIEDFLNLLDGVK
jgi:Asp/Glu/hydantoin racemase